jgi:hypothetical protein
MEMSGWLALQPDRFKSCDSSVDLGLGYGLDDRGSRVRFPAMAGNFSLHRRVQNGSRAHPASYPMGTRDSFPGDKAAGREADHSPPSSAEVKEWVELYVHSPNTPPWRGAQLKHRDNLNFTFTFTLPDRFTRRESVLLYPVGSRLGGLHSGYYSVGGEREKYPFAAPAGNQTPVE